MAYQPPIKQKIKLLAHEEPNGKVWFYYYSIYKELDPHDKHPYNKHNCGWMNDGYYPTPKKGFESFVNSWVEMYKQSYALKQHLSNDTIYFRGKTIHGPSWIFCEDGVEFEESDFPGGKNIDFKSFLF